MPTEKIKIPINKTLKNIFENHSKRYGSKYKTAKIALLALDSLAKLGLDWYHIQVLHYILTADTSYAEFRDTIIEHFKPLVNLLDQIIRGMLEDNKDDLKLFFSEKEIKVLEEILRD